MYWYYLRDGQQIGPITEDQLRDLVRRGVARGETPVWKEGMTDWSTVEAVPELPAPPAPRPLPASGSGATPTPTTTAPAPPHAPPGPPDPPVSGPASPASPAADHRPHDTPTSGVPAGEVMDAVEDNGRRAGRTRGLLKVNAGLAAVSLLVGVHEVVLLGQVMDGASVSMGRAEMHDLVSAVVALAQVALLLVTGVVFLRWFRRAHANLPLLGAEDLQFSPGWAVGYWFIPILNLVRPYHVAKEIWTASYRASSPRSGPGLANDADPNTDFLSLWWILFIAMSMVSNVAARLTMGADSLVEMRTASMVYLFSDLLTIVCAAAAVQVVGTLQRVQSEAASLRMMR